MNDGSNAESPYAATNKALQLWRQGDLVMRHSTFVHIAHGGLPLSDAARELGVDPQGATVLIETLQKGLVLLTQTCDVVRDCCDQPYVQLAPLIEVDAATWQDVLGGRRPRYATLPLLRTNSWVADLNQIMTAEKAVLCTYERTAGWTDEREARAFASALARKAQRFAFPDEFVEFTKKLQARFKDKHGKATPEGDALRALREIRVQASPAWDDPNVELDFFFIQTEHGAPATTAQLHQWLSLLPTSTRFPRCDGLLRRLEDLTAEEYVHSDPLDLDHLSSGDSHMPPSGTGGDR